MNFILCVLFLILTVSCSSTQNVSNAPAKKVVTDMHSDTLKTMKGLIWIEELPAEFKVTADISGLRPNGRFGFHIHENGICEGPDYKTAGEHFNPHNMPHGRPEAKTRHLGDLGNLESNQNGEAKKVVIIPKEQDDNLSMLIGKSLLIHAKADDLKTQPSGNSGKRIACGLIKPI